VGVDDVLVVEGEQEGVAAFDVPALVVVHFLVGPALALVLDDALALGDGEQGENAVAMDPGLAGGDFAGHCFSHAWINGHCGPYPVKPSYSTISVLLNRARPSAARHPPDRLRHRRPDRARRAASGRTQRGRTGRRVRPGSADRGQGAQAAGAGRPGRGLSRRRWRLPAAPRACGHQPGRDRGSDGRPAGHDRMQPACGQLRHRTVLRRARQLAPHQRRGRTRAARRDPGPDGRGSMNNATENAEILEQLGRRYDAGFITDIESDSLPPGLSEDIIRALSAKKDEPEWMTEWRLAAYRHWLTMPVPHWAKLEIAPIDFQAISYYSAPKGPKYKSLDEVPKELIDTYDKLGVPLHERAKLAGVAVDAVFDSVSVGTTFRKELADKGIVFCSMSEAIREHPDLVKQYLGSVVPVGDNYFAALNSAVFSDGSFVFIPAGVRCPMELSTYFRINAGH